jgi:hypothetical protein
MNHYSIAYTAIDDHGSQTIVLSDLDRNGILSVLGEWETTYRKYTFTNVTIATMSGETVIRSEYSVTPGFFAHVSRYGMGA